MPIRIKLAAQAIGVSTKTLLKLEEDGLVHPLRSRGGHRYYLPATIEQARAAFWPANPKQRKSETVSV